MSGSLVVLGSVALLPLIATAQVQQAAQSTAADYTVVAQAANSQVWQRVMPIATNQQGQIAYRTNSYKELATGMNHVLNGQWVPSSDEITITATGGVITNCAHAVGFATDINSSNAVEIITSDGQDLKTHIMGVSYFDSATGSNVLFAELQSSTGLLMKSNEVVYPNAFSGAKMDVRYDNTRSSFEQDIVIQEQLPDPSAYGLTPATTWLQVWTEFLDPPTPVITPFTNGSDMTLDFGSMKMPSGRAFIMGNESNSVSVKKQWLTIQGRTFLVEAVPLNSIAASLQTLPVSGGSGTNTPQQSRLQNFPKMLPPQPNLAARTGQGLKLATAPAPATKGLVMDYITVSTETNFTFQGDMTYYVSGTFNLNSNTTFEGGTVIKYADSGASLNIYGAVNCNTGPYRPAIFTSKDDNSVGLTISGGSGSPTTSASSIYLDIMTTGVTNLNNLRMSYAEAAIALGTTGSYVQISNLTLRDCQFVSNYASILVATSPTNPPTLHLQNVLFAGGTYGLFYYEPATTSLTCENVTSTAATFWTFGDAPNMALTNCIITGTFTTPASLSTNCTVIDPGGTVFQTLGAGDYYLAASSPYRNAGTTNIDPTLLADLQLKTTYPPLWLTNTITTDTTLFPQASRETAMPDLGFAYDPIDYLMNCGVTNDATLTLTNGVSLAYYNYTGIWLQDGGQLISQGGPLQRNVLAYYTLVQEQATNLSGLSNPSENALPINFYHTNLSANPSMYLRFTSLYAPDAASYFLYTYGGTWQPGNVTLRDCEIYGAGSYWSEDDSTNTPFTFQNNLFYETSIFALYTADNLTLYNNLFYGNANESVTEWDFASGNVTNHDNVFEGLSGVSLDGTNGWNAFINVNTNSVSPLPMTNDLVLSSLAWQTGPLGSFYQPTNSALINAGSRTADLAGLYHYTTQTNEMIESNSVVDIGYHYVALGTNGLPLDSNGDGIPDYLEDANGNGTVDAGETDWQNPSTGLSATTGIMVFTPLR